MFSKIYKNLEIVFIIYYCALNVINDRYILSFIFGLIKVRYLLYLFDSRLARLARLLRIAPTEAI